MRSAQFEEVGSQFLGFPVKDVREEIQTTIDLLASHDGNAGQSMGRTAVLLPYNVVAHGIWIAAQLLQADGQVVMRYSAKASELAEICQGVFLEVCPERVAVDMGRTGPEFVQTCLGDDETTCLVVYGSEDLGGELLGKAVGSRKRVVFEGPGNDPMLVLPGADLDQTMQVLRDSKFYRSGQRCVATERVLVHDSQYDEFLERGREIVADLEVGDPTDPQVEVGPIRSRKALEVMERQLREAMTRGARMLGDARVADGFVFPTLVADADTAWSVWKDESFGPLIAAKSYSTVSEAIGLALDDRCGLHCIVCGPEERARITGAFLAGSSYAMPSVSHVKQKFGSVSLNRPALSQVADHLAPFGGFGESGWIWTGTELQRGPKLILREAQLGAWSVRTGEE